MVNPALKYTLAAGLLLPAGVTYAAAPAKAHAAHSAPDYKKALSVLQKDSGPDISGSITAGSMDGDVILPPAGVKAVQLANGSLSAVDDITADDDGWVTYEYGHGVPIIVLEPLHLSAIRLEQGEFVSEHCDLVGDPRIHVEVRTFGEGPSLQTVVFLKPKDAGYSTDLVLATNKRLYTIRVVTKPHDYTPRIAFTYPDTEEHDEQAQQALQLAQQQAAAEKARADAALRALDTTGTVKNTQYDCKVKGHQAEQLKPEAIWDDKRRTHIQLPAGLAAGTLPVPKVYVGGKLAAPNYRYNGTELVIDTVFSRCELVFAGGRKVVITNKGEA